MFLLDEWADMYVGLNDQDRENLRRMHKKLRGRKMPSAFIHLDTRRTLPGRYYSLQGGRLYIYGEDNVQIR